MSNCLCPRCKGDSIFRVTMRSGLFMILAAASASLLCAQSGTSYLITTVAGNGTSGYAGDGGPATSAGLYAPQALALDTLGNLYIADNNRIRKVARNGIITTVAGNGIAGYSGDGGAATSASLNFGNYPGSTSADITNIAVDMSGNLYIPDRSNLRVRKITPDGIITTVAGNGMQGYFGDVGDGKPATSASLNSPNAVTIDSRGNLYIADANRVRMVAQNGIIVTVWDSSNPGISNFGYPKSMAVDGSGNLYLGSDYSVVKFTPGVGVTQTWSLKSSVSVIAADPSGNIYVGTPGIIQKLTIDTSNLSGGSVIATTIAGVSGKLGFGGDTGPALNALVSNEVGGIAVSATGEIFFSDSGNYRVRELVLQHGNGCQYSFDSGSPSFGPGGGYGTVGLVVSSADCGWLASSNASWITVTSSAIGAGNAVLTYSVAPNTNSASRSSSLSIVGRQFSISQAGVQCVENISPSNVVVPSGGQYGIVVAVSASAPDCGWTVQGNLPPWILINSGGGGGGNGTVTFTVGPNTGGYRTATINLAGQTLMINQTPPGVSVDTIPIVNEGGVVSVASGQGPVAPGSLVSIYGSGFTDGSSMSWNPAISNGGLPTTLNGVQVNVGGQPGYIAFASPTQLNVLVPPNSATGSVPITVTTNHGSAVGTAPMTQIAPAFFAQTVQGTTYLAAMFANDGVLVGNPGLFSGAASRAARPGDYIELYATGLGSTNPPYPSGQVLTKPYPISNPSSVSVSVGGQPAVVQFAGMTMPGVFQVNIQVPAGIPSGNLPVVLQIGGQSSQPNAVLTFQGQGGGGAAAISIAVGSSSVTHP